MQVDQGGRRSINLTGNTALHHAAHWGDPAVTDLLISWHTPEQVIFVCRTPCLHLMPEILSRLEMYGWIPLNARNVKGSTPLHEAAQDGSPAILSTLVHGGADLSAVNADGATVARGADRARRRGWIGFLR